MPRRLPLLLPALLIAALSDCMKAERLGTDTNSPDGMVFGSISLDLLGGLATGYAGAEFVAVGEACTVWASADGISWTHAATLPGCSGDLASVAHGNGAWVATGANAAGGSNCAIWTSPDGYTWQAASCPDSTQRKSVAFGNGMFIAGGSCDTNNQLLSISTDGATWTGSFDCASQNVDNLSRIVFDGQGHFVAQINQPSIGNLLFGGADQGLSPLTASALSLSTILQAGPAGSVDTSRWSMGTAYQLQNWPYSELLINPAFDVTRDFGATINAFGYAASQRIAVGYAGTTGCQIHTWTRASSTDVTPASCASVAGSANVQLEVVGGNVLRAVTAGPDYAGGPGYFNAHFYYSDDGSNWTLGSIVGTAQSVSAIGAR